MLSSLRRGPSDANTISPSSTPTHTQLICGAPLGSIVTRCASPSLSSTASASSGMASMGRPYLVITGSSTCLAGSHGSIPRPRSITRTSWPVTLKDVYATLLS